MLVAQVRSSSTRLAIVVAALALLLTGLAPSPALSATPHQVPPAGSVSISPTSGPAGTSISMTATGWQTADLDTAATIEFDGSRIASTIFYECGNSRTNIGFGSGCTGRPVAVSVPPNALPGRHTFTVVDRFGATAATSFVVPGPPTATPVSTPTSTPPPVPTTTTTPVPTQVPPSPTSTSIPGLPNVPPCTTPSTTSRLLAHVLGHDSPRYSGGDLISLTASGLPANTSLLLLFDGPRWRLQGTSATQIHYSANLGVAMSDSAGTLQTTVRLPDDATYGTGKIEAFARLNLRTGPVYTWPIDTQPHAPWIQISAPANLAFTISAGNQPAGDTGACSGNTGSNGSTRIAVNPGVDTIHFIGGDGTPHDHIVLGLPGEITPIDLGGVLLNPGTVQASCASNLEFLGVFDNLSGNQYVEDGLGPFGYFLHGVSVPETVILTLGTKDGSPIPASCAPTLSASIHDDSGPFSQSLGQFQPAPLNPDVNNFLGSLFPRADALDQALGSSILVGKLIHDVFTAFSSSSINYMITLNPGQFSAGDGTLDLTMQGVPLITPAFQIIDPHWSSSQFHQDAAPAFDPGTRTYLELGTIPQRALDYTFDPTFGWQSFGIIPGFQYEVDNELKFGLQTNEIFSTDGTWFAIDLAAAKAELVNNTFFDSALFLNPSYNNPDPPGMVLNNQELGSGFHYAPADPILSFPIVGLTIPFPTGNITIGFSVNINLAADLDAYLSGAVNPDFTLNNVTLTGRASFSLTATGGISVGIGGVGAGMQAGLTLSVPVHFQPGQSQPISVSPCLAGQISFVVNWWYNIYVSSGGGDIFNQPIASVNVPGGCTTADFRRLRAELHRIRGTIHTEAQKSQTSAGTPAVSTDNHGRSAAIWVKHNASGRDSLLAAVGRHGRFGKASTIARNRTAILSPQIAELGNGRIVAAWIQNTLTPKQVGALRGKPAVQVIAAMLQHQELYTATYNGHAWSAPRAMTTGKTANNDPALAADPRSHTALLVWSRIPGARGATLTAMRFHAGRWTHLVGVSRPGTLPFGSSLAWTGNRFALAWIAGAAGKGTVRTSTFAGGHWSFPSAPKLAPGVASVSIGGRKNALVVAAQIPAVKNHLLPAIWTARRAGTGRWTRQRIATTGTHPVVVETNTNTVILFSRPEQPDALMGTSQIAFVASQGVGRLGGPTLVTGQSHNLQNPVAAWDAAGRAVDLLYTTAAPSGVPAVTSNPNWAYAIKPSARSLGSGIGSVILPAKPDFIVALARASLSNAYPTPGNAVTLSVPVENVGIVGGTVSGSITATAGGQTNATIPLSGTVAPGTTTTASVSLTAPSNGISLSTQGVGSVTGKELGLPASSGGVTAGASASNAVNLAWTAPGNVSVAEYKIYRRDGSGSYTMVGVSHDTTFVDASASATGTQYEVTAVDQYGRESDFSPQTTSVSPG